MLMYRLVMGFSLTQSYAILGLKSTTPLPQVKKKYYELAKKYHPDLNSSDQNSHTIFADITKAYRNVIDNHDPTTQFQNQHKNNHKHQSNTPNHPFKNQKQKKTQEEHQHREDFFEQDSYFRSGKKHRKPIAGDDIYLNLTVSLQQAVRGIEKSLQFTRMQLCPSCSASTFASCFPCGGKGELYDRQNRQKVRCEACLGKGYQNPCGECGGSCFVARQVKQSVYVERGTQDKTILRVNSRGHKGYKSRNGDLLVTVFVEESSRFRVVGNNVHTEHEVDFVVAARGGITQIETLHGHKEVTLEAGVQSGSQLRLFNLGLKSPFSSRMGDQIVRIKIKIPSELTEKQRTLLLKLKECEA